MVTYQQELEKQLKTKNRPEKTIFKKKTDQKKQITYQENLKKQMK